MRIASQTVFVSGANRGLGRAIVIALLARGARKVYGGCRQRDALADLQRQYPGRLSAVSVDITVPEQVSAAAASCADTTLLINNAGINRMQGFIAPDALIDARAEMDTNYFGTLMMCRAFAPVLADNGGGAIVNVLSIMAKVTLPAMGSLCASKAAALRMTEGVRAELAGTGTRVIALLSGALDTDMNRDLKGPKSDPRDVATALLDGIEAGHLEISHGKMTEWINDALINTPEALARELASFLPVRKRVPPNPQ